MSESKNGRTVPKSMRQKRILDLAAERPDASMEDLAAVIPSATTECVERVLEEYGDPADGSPDQEADADAASTSQVDGCPDPEDLSEVQLETLRAICEHPDASQRELAEVLDVSAATVSNRVNTIEGFDWEERRGYAEATVARAEASSADATEGSEDGDAVGGVETADAADRNGDGGATAVVSAVDASTERETPAADGDLCAAVERVAERLAAVERQLDDGETVDGSDGAFDSPALVHKVMHACVESDAISEDEELAILKELLR